MKTLNTRAIVLAAGRSTRFKRKQSKLLTHICGQPMVLFCLKRLKKLNIPTTLVLGYQADEIKSKISNHGITNIDYVEQKEQLGTGHAVLCTKDTWDSDTILILNGDMPLFSSEQIEKLLQKHTASNSTISFFSTYVFNPEGYGRIVERDGILNIVEEKNCTEDEKSVTKVNAGVYAIKKSFLLEALDKIQKDKTSGEFYLVALAAKQGEKIQIIPAPFDDVRGVNTLQELWAVEQVQRSRLIEYWMDRGVRFELAQNIHIDIDAKIGEGSFIGTGVHLLGNTEIGEDCFISAFTILENTTVGNGSLIRSHSVIQDSAIGKDTQIGPFARLRNGVVIKDNVTVGNFVEMKKSTVGDNSKIKHLSYVGDAKVGNKVNIGAGTITCNYDGINKHQTVLKDGVFIGSNSTLVAPVTIGENAYTAAGSTINKDVGSGDLAIARSRQENKKGYAEKILNQKKNVKKETTVNYKTESVQKAFHFIGAVKTEVGSKEGV